MLLLELLLRMREQRLRLLLLRLLLCLLLCVSSLLSHGWSRLLLSLLTSTLLRWLRHGVGWLLKEAESKWQRQRQHAVSREQRAQSAVLARHRECMEERSASSAQRMKGEANDIL